MPDDKLENLTAIFRYLGARNPESWAKSQVSEGIPQLARFLFLRQAWSNVVADGDTSWITKSVEYSKARPQAPYSGVGQALERLLAQGASPQDIADVVRGMQAELLFNLCYLLEDPGDVPPVVADLCWCLVQTNDDGEMLGTIPGLHESVLDTDPSGREMRPRGPVV